MLSYEQLNVLRSGHAVPLVYCTDYGLTLLEYTVTTLWRSLFTRHYGLDAVSLLVNARGAVSDGRSTFDPSYCTYCLTLAGVLGYSLTRQFLLSATI